MGNSLFIWLRVKKYPNKCHTFQNNHVNQLNKGVGGYQAYMVQGNTTLSAVEPRRIRKSSLKCSRMQYNEWSVGSRNTWIEILGSCHLRQGSRNRAKLSLYSIALHCTARLIFQYFHFTVTRRYSPLCGLYF